MKLYDLIIIGGGPAGIGAALQAGRTGRRVLLAEKDILGGRLNHAFLVKNFPACSACGSPGKKLALGLAKQLETLDVTVVRGNCQTVDRIKDAFSARIQGRVYRSRTVIMAGGLEPRRLKVRGAGEAMELKRLVYYWDDIPCPLKNRTITVIGGGEVALDQACSLAFEGARVTVLVRGNKVKAYPGLIKMAEGLGVKLKYGFTVDRITLNGPDLSLHDQDNRIVNCDHAVAAIGSAAPKTIVSGQARKRMNKGLYLAGDLANKNYRQAAIAFGSGVKAAMVAEEYMKRI